MDRFLGEVVIEKRGERGAERQMDGGEVSTKTGRRRRGESDGLLGERKTGSRRAGGAVQ